MFLLPTFFAEARENTSPDFQWGNTFYFNLNTGDSVVFEETTIKLLITRSGISVFQVGPDTIQLGLSRRSLPANAAGLKLFVAGNNFTKMKVANPEVFGLVKKDVLLAVSNAVVPLLDRNRYYFPVSFNDGFVWDMEEDTYLFSVQKNDNKKEGKLVCHPGINFDLNDARGLEKHWLLAIENSKVVWVDDKNPDDSGTRASVLLQSEENPKIYYLYENLYRRNLEVRNGQAVRRGEPVGTAWGEGNWCHFQFSVLFSEIVPDYKNRHSNVLNFFPQLYELYYGQAFNPYKSFSKGRIFFNQGNPENGNEKNLSEFEDYLGKGWVFESFNPAGRVEGTANGTKGNARLTSELFAGTGLEYRNSTGFFKYEINVPNGVYRIRARVGDSSSASWQKVSFEGIAAGIIAGDVGEFSWTGEKIVRITDRRLTICIFTDPENKKPAGITEIVFQRAN